jgi:alpha-ribazole phosphatase
MTQIGNLSATPTIRLFLLRHGAIAGTGEKCFVGQMDLELSQAGKTQAEKWRDILKPVNFSQIWSSDLKRAVETADIIADRRRPIIRKALELREINMGEWDGMPMADIREQFPECWEARGNDFAEFRPPGAETFIELQHRVMTFIQSITFHSTGNILIITHAGVIRVLLCHVLRKPLSHLFQLHLDYGGLTLIKEINGRLQVMKINQLPDTPLVFDH